MATPTEAEKGGNYVDVLADAVILHNVYLWCLPALIGATAPFAAVLSWALPNINP